MEQLFDLNTGKYVSRETFVFCFTGAVVTFVLHPRADAIAMAHFVAFQWFASSLSSTKQHSMRIAFAFVFLSTYKSFLYFTGEPCKPIP